MSAERIDNCTFPVKQTNSFSWQLRPGRLDRPSVYRQDCPSIGTELKGLGFGEPTFATRQFEHVGPHSVQHSGCENDSAEMNHMRQIICFIFVFKVFEPVLLDPQNKTYEPDPAPRDLFNCRKCFCLAAVTSLTAEWMTLFFTVILLVQSDTTSALFFFLVPARLYEVDSAQVCFCPRARACVCLTGETSRRRHARKSYCAGSEINVRKLRRLSCLK